LESRHSQISNVNDFPDILYWRAQTKKEVIGGIITEFLERVFDGSATLLLGHLIEDRHLTDNDIEKIRRAMHSERK
jgi:predicted transcriptional regulator